MDQKNLPSSCPDRQPIIPHLTGHFLSLSSSSSLLAVLNVELNRLKLLIITFVSASNLVPLKGVSPSSQVQVFSEVKKKKAETFILHHFQLVIGGMPLAGSSGREEKGRRWGKSINKTWIKSWMKWSRCFAIFYSSFPFLAPLASRNWSFKRTWNVSLKQVFVAPFLPQRNWPIPGPKRVINEWRMDEGQTIFFFF